MTAARQVPTIVFRLFVPGKPAAQGSKRHVGGGRMVEQSKAVAPWRTTVAWHAAQAYTQAPQEGQLTVGLVFVMPRPASTPKRSTPPAVKRPDLDKLQRAIFDALSGVIWRDDSQVTYVAAAKRIAGLDDQPGVHIEVIAQDARWTAVDRPSVHGDGLNPPSAHDCTPGTGDGQ